MSEAQESAHEAILRQLPENILTKIALDNNTAIEWKEEGREFKLNGEMYDVVRTTSENGKIYLNCFSDKNEDAILEKFQSVIKNTIDDSTNRSNHTVNFIMPDWVFEIQEIVITNSLIVLPPQKYIGYAADLCSADVKITYSPPDILI